MSLATLSAFALNHLLKGIRYSEQKRAYQILTALVGFTLALAGGVWVLSGRLLSNFGLGAGITLVSSIGIGICLVAKWHPRFKFALLVGLCIIDLGFVNFSSLSPRLVSSITSDREDVARFLSKKEGEFRVYSPSYSLPQFTAALYGLELADGIDPIQMANYETFMEQASGIPSTKSDISGECTNVTIMSISKPII